MTTAPAPGATAPEATGSVTVDDVTIGFPTDTGEFIAVRDCSLDVNAGEFLSVVGPSGCGKSTMLFAIDGLYQASQGRILVNGEPVTRPRPDRAMVFQEFGLLPWRTVVDNVLFPLELSASPQKLSRSQRRDVAGRYLKLVGLDGFDGNYPHQLSGGMKQRVGIARAFATGAGILLMDEPFAAVDAQTRDIMGVELLRVWEAERKTVIFVTHSIEEAVFLGDRVVVMTAGPTKVKEIIDVDLGRPRPLDIRTTPRFAEIRQHVWDSLKAEVLKNPQFKDVEV
jgi:NitT/TauT family transport system ATP-binding protein